MSKKIFPSRAKLIALSGFNPLSCRPRRAGINWTPVGHGYSKLDLRSHPFGIAGGVLCLFLMAGPLNSLTPPQLDDEVQDITSEYHFLSADDTLALLEEEGKLHGYIDVYQNDEESDTVLSYTVTSGSRKKDHVEFKTNRIHQKFYRFSGAVQRGAGHEEGDPDYLRLVGNLETVMPKAGSGEEEAVQRMRVVFKSLGKSEKEER